MHGESSNTLSSPMSESAASALTLASDRFMPSEASANAQSVDGVCILHGLFGATSNWRSVARKISDTRPVIVADARNHGRSPWHPDMTYPLMAADTIALLQSQMTTHAQRAIVIGHSMGGKTAMILSLLRPDLVAKLVIVDIAPKSYGHSHIDVLHAMRHLDLTAIGSRAEANRALSASILDVGVRQFALQNLVSASQPSGPTRYQWRLNLDAIERNMAALVDWPNMSDMQLDVQFEGPTLFIRGGRSDYVGKNDEPLIRRYFPNATIDTVDDAGHWPHAERADAFMASLSRFIS